MCHQQLHEGLQLQVEEESYHRGLRWQVEEESHVRGFWSIMEKHKKKGRNIYVFSFGSPHLFELQENCIYLQLYVFAYQSLLGNSQKMLWSRNLIRNDLGAGGSITSTITHRKQPQMTTTITVMVTTNHNSKHCTVRNGITGTSSTADSQ